MNRTFTFGLFAAAVLAMPFAPPALAHRGECYDACQTAWRDCSAAAKDANYACRDTCEAENPDGGSDLFWCLRHCTADSRAERATCRVDRSACKVDCKKPDGGDPECRATCGQALGECLGSAGSSFVDCQFDCPKGPEREACVTGCEGGLEDEAAGCKSDHEACFDGCGSATTTSTIQETTTTTTETSTTTTTTVPQPPCESTEAPTCGGSCPEPLQVCQATEPDGACGCVGTSVSGAFTRFGFSRR